MIYNKDENQTLCGKMNLLNLKDSKVLRTWVQGFLKLRLTCMTLRVSGLTQMGFPRTHPSSKGVWLSGYQFKLYYNQPETIFRATGFQLNWGFSGEGGWRGRDNFHLNRGVFRFRKHGC